MMIIVLEPCYEVMSHCDLSCQFQIHLPYVFLLHIAYVFILNCGLIM
jgi:hypothetical protein